MNRRTFATLAIVAAVLALLAVLGQNTGGGGSIAGDSAGEALLPGLAASLDAIERIEVTGAGDERLVSLTRGEEGWAIAELDGYPAETARVNGLLIELGEARIVEEKTSDPAFYPRLGVESVAAADAGGLGLALVGAGGMRFELILGTAYGSGQRYARLPANATSVLIDADPDIARAPSDWVRPGIVDIDPARIRRVATEHADGETLVVYRESPDAADFSVEDVPAGRELQYAGVANVAGNALQGLTLDEVAPAPPAAGEADVVAEYSTFDGLVITVAARTGDDGNPWLRFRAAYDAAAPAAAGAADADADADAGTADAVAAEAEAINARLGGWRYRIPAFKYNQMMRRMEDLLRAPEPAGSAQDSPE